jgi:hypothetical protein
VLVGAAVVGAVGVVAFTYLRRNQGFSLFDPARSPRALGIAATAATLLALPTILVDVASPFPSWINVPWPDSLVFYPLIGTAAEIAFHVLPIAIALAALRRILGAGAPTRRQVTGCLVAVAAIEPTLQVAAFWADVAPWLLLYQAVHIYVFNLVQLVLFRRHGAVTMYAMRLVYYLYWHIAWGHLRLELLF